MIEQQDFYTDDEYLYALEQVAESEREEFARFCFEIESGNTID